MIFFSTSLIVLFLRNKKEWKTVTYIVFDAPGLKSGFKTRYQLMKEAFEKINSPYIKLHPHIVCEGRKHLDDELEKVLKSGGEGTLFSHMRCFIFLQRPSIYQ